MKNPKTGICHISTAHLGLDIRIFQKECTTLALQPDMEVHLIIQDTHSRNINGVHIHALPIQTSRLKRFISNGWLAFRTGLKTGSVLFHFHDPEFIPFAILLKLFGKKVIYDVHENLPKDILEKEWVGGTRQRKIVSGLARLMQQFGALFFDGIISVSDEIAADFPARKSHVISNYPILSKIDSIAKKDLGYSNPILIYTGGLTRIRGIKELIQAMDYIEDAKLILMGTWSDSGFEKECLELLNKDKVEVIEQQPLEVAYTYMKAAHVGVVNFLPVANHVNSRPNKPFEYMASGIPIVMSSFEAWKEIFQPCALFANPQNPSEIAHAIKRLLQDPELASTLGQAGRKEILDNYSWESITPQFLTIYHQLLKQS
ncbi:MAG: glycosyltransferase family 4 protein [Bacteroidia bacterium]|nr:glycosyltransferase family 4 protein [Bacteroidia bacterium]